MFVYANWGTMLATAMVISLAFIGACRVPFLLSPYLRILRREWSYFLSMFVVTFLGCYLLFVVTWTIAEPVLRLDTTSHVTQSTSPDSAHGNLSDL